MNITEPNIFSPIADAAGADDSMQSGKAKHIISDQAELPIARYVSFSDLGLPAHYTAFSALYATGEQTAILLIADTAAEDHQAFDLRDRIASSPYVHITEQLATAEIISVAHAANVEAESTDNTHIETIAFALIDEAHARGASDIHMETRGNHADVLFRIDGVRVKIRTYTMKTAMAINSVLFNVHADPAAKTQDWTEKEWLDTVVPYTQANGEAVQLRFNSGPIYPSGNVSTVLRLGAQSKMRQLEELGYTEPQIAHAEDMIIGSQGMVILVGPTGSGKTTTMHALLDRIEDLRGAETKVMTLESPVELHRPNATQVSISDNRESASYRSALRATFRQDPDGVMFGEIQERPEAEYVKNLVLAGRKLVTTLHVFEVFAVFARLRELGIPDSVLYMPGFISGVIYTRLLPKLCTHCRTPLEPENRAKQMRTNAYKRLKAVIPDDHSAIHVRTRKGCEKCNMTGYKGRTPCVEMLIPDRTLLAYLRKDDETAARDYWLTANPDLDIDGRGHSAIAHAVHWMLDGVIDPNDIEIFLGPLVIEKPSTAQE
ncbi:Flp pilus assembly complex ATPase component TadA [Rugamonas sp. A1-17]|nr:Flp pilus assembly complex ATPase component TadA [Rugamonas sp. A1-17]